MAAVPKEVHGIWKGPFDEKAPGIKVKLRRQRRLGREAATELRPFTSRGCRKNRMMAVISVLRGKGVYMRGLLKGMNRGGSKGSHLCKPSAPVRTLKAELFLVLFCRPG